MRRWYVLLKDWTTYKAGTRLELAEEDGKKLVADGTAHGPFSSQQEASDWKPPASPPPAASTTTPAPGANTPAPTAPAGAPSTPAGGTPPPTPASAAADIIAACRLHWRAQPARALEIAGDLVARGLSIDQARAEIEARLRAEQPPVGAMPSGHLGSSMSTLGAEAEADKFAQVATEALCLRFMRRDLAEVRAGYEFRAQTRPLLPAPRLQLGQDSLRFASMRLIDFLGECIFRGTGRDVRYLPAVVIADIALGNGRAHGFHAAEYHSPADLPNLVLDAANVTVARAYMTAPSTFRQWVEPLEPADDYKPHYIVKVSEAGVIDSVPDGEDLKEKKFTDAKETLIIQTRGNAFSWTRQMMIDGNVEALSRMLIAVGRACELTQNLSVYALLKANPTMADGVALFHANHGNLVTGGGVPSKAQMQKVDQKFALQKGLDGVTPTNLKVRHWIGPRNIRVDAEEFFGATSQPSQANPSVPNVFNRELAMINVITDSALDSVANDPWYCATDYRDCGHFAIKYLRGEESPVVNEEVVLRTGGGLVLYVVQTYGVQVYEHRGIVKNPGA